MKLGRRVAIITGGASRIGQAISTLFARGGAGVVVADIDLKHAISVVGKIRAAGGSNLAAGWISLVNSRLSKSYEQVSKNSG